MRDPNSNSPDHIDVGESIVTMVSHKYMYAMHELVLMGPFWYPARFIANKW